MQCETYHESNRKVARRWRKDEKSVVVVRAKVPWEKTYKCLIAVVLDVENNQRDTKNGVENVQRREYVEKRVREKRREGRMWNSERERNMITYQLSPFVLIPISMPRSERMSIHVQSHW